MAPKKVRIKTVHVRWSENGNHVFADIVPVVSPNSAPIPVEVTSAVGPFDSPTDVYRKVTDALFRADYLAPENFGDWTIDEE